MPKNKYSDKRSYSIRLSPIVWEQLLDMCNQLECIRYDQLSVSYLLEQIAEHSTEITSLLSSDDSI